MDDVKTSKKIKYFIYLFIFLVPLSTVFSRFLLNFIIVFFFAFLLFYSIKYKYWDCFKSNIAAYTLIFFMYLLLTNILYHDANLKIILKLIWIFAIIFIIFTIPKIFLLLNKNNFKYSFTIFLFSFIVFVQLDTIYQYFNPNFQDIFGYETNSIRSYTVFDKVINLPIRLTGPFGDEQVVGFYLATYGLLSIYLLKRVFCLSWRLYFILIIFNYFIIILSGERSSVIIYTLTIIISEFLFPIKIYKKILIFFSIISFLLAFVYFNPTTKERFADINYYLNFNKNKDDIAETSNLVKDVFKTPWGTLWYSSFLLWESKPLLGIGIKNYQHLCPELELRDKENVEWSQCNNHPHNYFFELLAETGLVGLFLFFLIIFEILKNFILKFRKNDDMIMVVSILIALLFPLKPSGALFSSWYGSFFWFIIAFYIFIEKKENDH